MGPREPQDASNPAVTLLALAVAVAVYCAVFAWGPPAPRYYPVERVWRMPSNPAPGPAMGWYGRTGTALGAAAVAAGGAAVVLRRRDRARRIELGAVAVYAIAAAIVLCVAVSCASIVREQRAWFAKPPATFVPGHEY